MTTATTLAQCDACTPLGFEHLQLPDEEAIYVPRMREWLCTACRTAKGVTLIPAQDGLYPEINELDYHADRDSLSSTGARTLLWSSPAKFWQDQQTPPEPKKEYDFGHIAHLLNLGKGQDFTILDPAIHGLKKDGTVADSPRSTSTWKDAEAEARKQNKIPVHIDDYAAAQAMAKAVRDHPVASGLLAQGSPEISGYWHDPITEIRLRLRTDWLHQGRTRLIIVDYKTTKSARPSAFWKSCADYGYHQQDAWYRDGVAAITDDDPLFLFIAQEKTPPYLVSVHEMPPELVERGRALNRTAIDRYAQCRERDEWPGYGDGIHTVKYPNYTTYREEDVLI